VSSAGHALVTEIAIERQIEQGFCHGSVPIKAMAIPSLLRSCPQVSAHVGRVLSPSSDDNCKRQRISTPLADPAGIDQASNLAERLGKKIQQFRRG